MLNQSHLPQFQDALFMSRLQSLSSQQTLVVSHVSFKHPFARQRLFFQVALVSQDSACSFFGPASIIHVFVSARCLTIQPSCQVLSKGREPGQHLSKLAAADAC